MIRLNISVCAFACVDDPQVFLSIHGMSRTRSWRALGAAPMNAMISAISGLTLVNTQAYVGFTCSQHLYIQCDLSMGNLMHDVASTDGRADMLQSVQLPTLLEVRIPSPVHAMNCNQC